jgi:Carboxypeptidase regulatory-like domain
MTQRIAILCLLSAASWAQAPPTVSGRVVSAIDGSPLPGALVLVRTTSIAKTWTGPDGRFRLAGVPTGTYGLLATKAGFHSDQRRQQVAAGDAEEIVIRLTPESLIAGTAVGPDGAPLEGAAIALWEQPDRLGNVPTLVERQNVTVDDLGRFRLHGLRAGNYLLELYPTAAPAPDGVKRLTAAPLLYPEPSVLGALATLRLRPGEHVENLDLRASEPGQTALAGQFSVCGACTVGVYRRAGEFFAPVYAMGAAGDGSFFLEGLAPGAYVIATRGRESNAGLAEVSLAAGQTTRTTVYLSEGAQMRITKKHLNPPEQEQDTQQRGAGPPAVMFEYLGPESAGGTQRGNGFARGQGDASEYQVGLAPGPYALRVRGIPRGGYLASVLVDGSPPLNGRILLGDGGTHETEVVVAYDSGTVEGVVTASDDLPLKDAQIYLLPQNPVLPNEVSEASADETGAFSVEVGPGRYDVYAMPRDADWNLANQEDRQRLAGYRANVEVRSRQKATVKVKLAPLSSW